MCLVALMHVLSGSDFSASNSPMHQTINFFQSSSAASPHQLHASWLAAMIALDFSEAYLGSGTVQLCMSLQVH